MKNLIADPNVTLRVGDIEMDARSRIVEDSTEEYLPRRLLAAKYQGWEEGAEMSNWARTALVIAIDPQRA